MKMHVFTVRDSIADVFGQPFFGLSIGGAVRGFADAINGGDPHLSKHPNDFELYRLGLYDDADASFSDLKLERIGVGRDLYIPSPNPQASLLPAS